MMIPSPIFVGIDPTAGRSPFTYAALDQERQLVELASGEVDELMAYLTGQKSCIVAINAPPRLNLGLVRKKLEMQNVAPGQLRGSDMREAEWELRERGISVLPTPSRLEICPGWMQMGFDLYRRLEMAGFTHFSAEKSTYQWLETHPHAAFCSLLGKIPLSKPTLEGRLQRQIGLYEQDTGIQDPMEFFEEITRHKLLHGVLPVEYVYSCEELDALMAAYMAYYAVNFPEDTLFIGEPREGQIALPVARLKDRYN